MGISNIASNLRPGICTSSTRPTTPYEGQVIYETDTNRTLVWDNAAWISLAQSGGAGLVKIIPTVSGTGASVDSTGTITVSSGTTSFTVIDAFNSNFEAYEIVVSDLTLSTDAGIAMQLRTSTTTSTTGYYYMASYGAAFYSGSGLTTTSSANQTSWDLFTLAGSGGGGGARFTLVNPFLSKKTTLSGGSTDARSTGNARMPITGFHDPSTSYTSFVLSSAANFTRCRVSVYGYNQ
jgi:hypothetical protein